MALKNFDFKKFMLQKGDKAILWSCLSGMVVMFGFGVLWAAKATSPKDTARGIETEAERIQNLLATHQPPAELKQIPPELEKPTNSGTLDIVANRAFRNFFWTNWMEGTKRQRIEVLPPEELTAQVLMANVRTLIISPQGNDVFVKVISGDTGSAGSAGSSRTNERQMTGIKNRFAGMSGYGMPTSSGSGGTGARPVAATAPPQLPPGLPPQVVKYLQARMKPRKIRAGDFDFESPPNGKTSKFVKWDETKMQNAHLAETIQPYRMAIISGDFPYKKQLESLQVSLRHRTLGEMFADQNSPIEFRGFNVQRMITSTPAGAVPENQQKWEDLKLDETYKPVLMSAAEIEPDEPELAPVLVEGLRTPRPALRDQKYPKVEVPGVKKTLDELRERGKAAQSAVEKQNSRFSNRFTGLFNTGTDATAQPGREGREGMTAPANPATQPKTGPGGRSGPGGETSGGAAEQELWTPDSCLLRFIDVDVKPGFTYSYRVQVKMLNPSYWSKDVAYPSLAEKEELVSEWSKKVATVRLPEEMYYYVLDQKALDDKSGGGVKGVEDAGAPVGNPEVSRGRTYIQVHRWLAEERISDHNDNTYPIGSWSIAERVPAYRGEYIGKKAYVELPVWNEVWEAYLLPNFAGKVKGRKRDDRGVPVDFNSHAVLVDFEGGRGTYAVGHGTKTKTVVDDAPVEMLVLTPDGKLEVHNSRDDSVNEERVERHKQWSEFVKKVKEELDQMINGTKGGTAGGDTPLFNKPSGSR